MALIVGINSWVTVAEADIYFSEKWDASNWATLTNAQKESLLITAYRWIQQQSFFSIPASSTASIVKQAQMETAWYIYKFWEQHEKHRALDSQGVEAFKISSFSEKLKGGGFPNFIKDMLTDYLIDLGGKFPTITRDFE